MVRPRTVQVGPGDRIGRRAHRVARAPFAGRVRTGAVHRTRGYRCPMAYWVFKALLSPVFFLLWRIKVEGREHVSRTRSGRPRGEPPVLLRLVLPAPRPLGEGSPMWQRPSTSIRWRTAWFFRAAGQIPSPTARAGIASQRALGHGEGRCSRDGKSARDFSRGNHPPDTRLHRGHTGVARLTRSDAMCR